MRSSLRGRIAVVQGSRSNRFPRSALLDDARPPILDGIKKATAGCATLLRESDSSRGGKGPVSPLIPNIRQILSERSAIPS